jgi:hypothetical protein
MHPPELEVALDLDRPSSERIIRMAGGYWIARLKRAMPARSVAR